MSISAFKGTGVAVVTPFAADNSVDFNALGRIIDHLVEGEVEYLVVLGTTGESVTLGKEEKKSVYRFFADRVAGRVPLMAGIGGNYTAELLDTIKHFDFTGYGAMLSVCPYYNKPNQQGIINHYRKVADATPVPVILYNVPGRTGVNMTAETTLQLAEHGNIAGMKEASGNFEQCMQIIQYKPSDFLVISGDDAITLPLISCGMDGVISVIANAYPKQFSDMVRATLAGDMVTARIMHYPLLELMKLIFADGSPGGIKAILKKLGICESTVREPLAPVSPAVHEKIMQAMTLVK